ncbi:MAG: hypothetical protein AABX47_04505 [Nanoarchaeota archaeon]
MEDIEKLKKIAKLSQEMRKHGFANYNDDAVKVAEGVYQDKNSLADAQTPEQRHQALKETRSMANQSTPENENFVKQTTQRLTEIETNVSTLIGKMNEMIKEINALQKGGGSHSSSAPERRESQAPLPKAEPKQGSGTEPHARSGNYTPADVQIDKIFYFGSGKKPT